MLRTKDVIVTYALLSPTVVVGARVPQLCLEQQWVLCISHTGEERIPEVARWPNVRAWSPLLQRWWSQLARCRRTGTTSLPPPQTSAMAL